MIAIVDYGLGNVAAFANIFKRLHVPAEPARTAKDLEAASRIILPGVGAFDQAMDRLNQSGMREAIGDRVLRGKVPLLGVCVGMQMLAESSEEGRLPGLSWIPGVVRRLGSGNSPKALSLPHMGWNDVLPRTGSHLFGGLEVNARFYFLHSYFFAPESGDCTLAETDYGAPFSSAVRKDNIYGVQFHPEKSHEFGVQLLRNFATL
jgi:glutamine amidotransferase